MSLVGEAVLLIALLTAGALVLLFLPTRTEHDEPLTEQQLEDVDEEEADGAQEDDSATVEDTQR